jgi:hypothetical protein
MCTRIARPAPLAACALIALSSGGCTETFQSARPMPKIELVEKQESLRLELADTIADEAEIKSGLHHGEPAPLRLLGWRSTLAEGYLGGLGRVFRGGAPGRTLRIEEAALKFLPVETTHVHGVIRFRARLLDASGVEGGSSSGFVTSRTLSVRGDLANMASSAASAVEAMYEAIAQDLFGGPAVQRACTPGTGVVAAAGTPGMTTFGTPGTPGTWVGGSPGVPGSCSGGGPNMPMTCTPGIPATPPMFIAGAPPQPGMTWPGVASRPQTACVPPTSRAVFGSWQVEHFSSATGPARR